MSLMQDMVRGILTLDGAMGTELIARGAKGALELCNVENPAMVSAIHEAYLEAGADIISTNTTCADALPFPQRCHRCSRLRLGGAHRGREPQYRKPRRSG